MSKYTIIPVTVERYLVDGVEFKHLEDATQYLERKQAAEERAARAKEIHEMAQWMIKNVRAKGLPFNASGCAEFMVRFSDQLVERLGYEVIDVEGE